MRPVYPLALFAIATASVAMWFRNADLIYFWDATVPLAPGRAIAAFASVVRADFWPSRLDLAALATIPYAALLWLFGAFGHDVRLGQRALFVVLYAAPFLTAYAAFSAWLDDLIPDGAEGNRAAAAAAALCYGCNGYVLFNLWRIFDLNTFVYAILPLLALFAERYVRRGRARDLALLATCALAGVPGYTNPGAVAGFAIGFAAWTAVGAIAARRDGGLVRGVAALAAVALACAPFVIPQTLGIGSLVARLASQGTWPALGANAAHATLWNVLRLIGDGATYETYPGGDPDYPWAAAYHAEPLVVVATSVLPLLAIAGLAVRRTHATVAAAVAALTVALLAMGPRAPLLGPPFFACFRSVTLCSAFRNPFDKFGLTLPLWESLLAAAFLASVVRFARARGAGAAVWAPVCAAFVALPMFAGWPLFTGAVERATSQRPASRAVFPPDFARAAGAVERGAPVLVLPWTHEPLVAERWRSGYVGYDPLQFATYATVASTDSQYAQTNDVIVAIERALAAGPSARAVAAARALGFRSIAVRGDDDPTFTPDAALAPRIARNLARLAGPGTRTSTVTIFPLGDRLPYQTAATIVLAPPELDRYTSPDDVVIDPATRHAPLAGVAAIAYRPATLRFDGDETVRARAPGVPVRTVRALRRTSVEPRALALVAADASPEYPEPARFPALTADARSGTLATAWHQRYLETAVALAKRTAYVVARLPVANASGGDARLDIDVVRGPTALAHASVAIPPHATLTATAGVRVPAGATLVIVHLLADPDRRPVSMRFGVLRVAEYARDPTFSVRDGVPSPSHASPVRVVASATDRTTLRLPAGPAVAFAALAASSDVAWELDDGTGSRVPDAIAHGFAPVWFVRASPRARTLVLTDRSAQRGRVAFLAFASIDAVTLAGLWFFAFRRARRPDVPMRA